MANANNLVPLNTLPKSHQREIQQKGTAAAAKARAEKKALKETLLALLETPQEQDGETTDGYGAIGAALFKQALSGNVKAFEVIRDTIGEKPTDNMHIDNTLEMMTAYERAAAAVRGQKL